MAVQAAPPFGVLARNHNDHGMTGRYLEGKQGTGICLLRISCLTHCCFVEVVGHRDLRSRQFRHSIWIPNDQPGGNIQVSELAGDASAQVSGGAGDCDGYFDREVSLRKQKLREYNAAHRQRAHVKTFDGKTCRVAIIGCAVHIATNGRAWDGTFFRHRCRATLKGDVAHHVAQGRS